MDTKKIEQAIKKITQEQLKAIEQMRLDITRQSLENSQTNETRNTK